MLDSVSLPWQALLWPTIGAAVILAVGRFLPGWLCRLLAFVAAAASLTTLWSLNPEAVDGVEIVWEPLNLLRAGPTLRPDGLSLFVGMILAGVIAILVLGSRDAESPKTTSNGLILIALLGCLVVVMAGNLLTLALGSGLLDLALIAMAASMPGKTGRVAWRMAVPGCACTLVLVLSAVQLDTQVGTSSLLAQNLPLQTLILVGIAGVLRILIFPLHPRGLNTSANACAHILAVGAGVYLLARVQAIAPVLGDRSWMLSMGTVALGAGGLLAWAGAGNPAEPVGQASGARATRGSHAFGVWLGIAIHQTGFALLFVVLVGASAPWPLMGLALALATLAVWWSVPPDEEAAPRSRWVQWVVSQLQPWWDRAKARVRLHLSILDRWQRSWLGQRGTALLPAVALASLAGAPLTAGALGRWLLYATLLRQGAALILMTVLAADTLLAAGLWVLFQHALAQAGEYRPRPSATLAMLILALLLILIGIVPGSLLDALSLKPLPALGISVWGLGLIYVLPWLLGGWLARIGPRVGRALESVRHAASLDWLFRGADWAGQRLVGGLHWLGQVGEGDGWWGWALIILALGAIFLIAH